VEGEEVVEGDRNHFLPQRSKSARKVTSPSPSDSPSKGLGKKRRFMTAEKKFPIYLEAQNSDKPVAKLLRREGLYSTDLWPASANQAKEGALQRPCAKPGHPQAKSALRPTMRPRSNSKTRSEPWRISPSYWRSFEKNERGFVGAIASRWIHEHIKLEILMVIETSSQLGLSAGRCCAILSIAYFHR